MKNYVICDVLLEYIALSGFRKKANNWFSNFPQK